MPLINYIGNRQEALGGGAGGFVRGGAPPPPALSIDYLIVGGGATDPTGTGGSAGGVLSGSSNIVFDSILSVNVGLGGVNSLATNGGSSSLSGSTFGFFEAQGGKYAGNSGNNFSQGGGGPFPIGNGGGAGSSQNGVSGVQNLSGRGGSGSLWLNGIYYAGGGGGAEKNPTVAAGAGMDGGGDGYGFLPGITGSNGRNGTGGGCGGGLNGTGGSGVVIIRYSTSSVTPPYDNAIAGGTLEISGGYAYHTFTSSAQLTYRF
jgi:hypothetical protein